MGCTNFPRFTSDWCSLAPKYKLIKAQPATSNDERANLPFLIDNHRCHHTLFWVDGSAENSGGDVNEDSMAKT